MSAISEPEHVFPHEVDGSSTFEKTTLGELLKRVGGTIQTGPFGTKLQASEYTNEGVPVISVGEIGDGRLKLREDSRRVDASVTSRMPEYVLRKGDIVFARKGAVERSAQIQFQEEGYFLGSDGIRLRLPNEHCDQRFFAYLLRTKEHRDWMIQHAAGSTMLSLNENIIRRIPIVLPPLVQQRRIADTLGMLDDKIEVNRRMAGTLEELARTLFRAWFVEFLPVRAKVRARAEGRDPERAAMAALSGRDETDLDTLSPDSLIALSATAALFPEMWEEADASPQGWTDGTLDGFARLTTTGVQPSAEPDAVFEHYSIPAYDDGNGPAMDRGDSIKSGKYAVHPDAVLVSKLNPNTPRVWMPNVKTPRAICSTEFMPFVPHDVMVRPFLYLLMDSDQMREEVLQRVTGSTGSRQRAQPSQIATLPVAVPPTEIVRRFSKLVAPQLALASSLMAERLALVQVRDALLPVLLAGNAPETD